jgi:hypothetical protein
MAKPPSFYSGFFEPESAANTDYQPDYRYNHVTVTPRGHSFEMDDTVDRERIRLSHRSGTFIEMHPDGKEVHKVYGDGYEIIIQDKIVYVKGKCNITVEGDCNINIKGDLIEKVEGNVEQHIKGNYSQIVEGISSITSQGDLNIKAGGSGTGMLSISTGDCLYLDADLTVDGEITGSKITSTGRIDAWVGVSAGPLGFVTLTGGVSVGFPAAPPFQIVCTTNMFAGGVITGGTSVLSPLVDCGKLSAILMTDEVNTGIYDSHIHISPKGPTGPPSPGPMV